MDWFLCGRDLRHERLNSFLKTSLSNMFDKFLNALLQTDFNIRVAKFQQNDAF